MIAKGYSHLYESGSFMVVKNHSHYVGVIAKKLCKKQCIFSCTKFLTSPRRLRAKYTPRTNLRFMLSVFRDCIELSHAGVTYTNAAAFAYAGYGSE